ncbi:hypothetical protein POTOM_055334 [Populus tomentosa]|uniref:Uncharacterized protein n=1 Tax=Populus tomentosa TaxID=118781 RepID=A0A8X7Y220_POPTO|nr:hypothetical protein POTOM_055334 [Populus tomentosa]
MIAAMANFLGYDLELTTVRDNSDLRKLLIETTGKSIVVIEDIDCSLDLTGQRKKKEKDENDAETGKEKDPISMKKRANALVRLDPALIRRGRMDKSIEMSYCRFEAFKSDEEDDETCLKCLIEALEASKEEARKESEEEPMFKAEKADKGNGEASSSKEEAGSSKRGWNLEHSTVAM